ncbi:MAG: PHP domain-containing protein [Lachnospiraceae bacterium]|nr:PHP domain-containing protein [Lachnospiraceae bacterium]
MMNTKICDFHTHSTFSDGSLTPTELVSLAEKSGVNVIALTDHNTSKGLPEFMEAGRRTDVITVPGCEFTTDYEGTEIHVIGLFFPEESWPEIEDYVELMSIAKRKSNRQLVDSLRAAGYDVTYEEIQALTDAQAFNRAHVARVLRDKGYVSSVQEAFQKILGENCGFYTPPKRLNALTTIRFIALYGGVPVLAHPLQKQTEAELNRFLPEAKEAGLVALESHYSTFTEEETAKLEAMAERFGLKNSGGSDFHGSAKPDIALGRGRGGLVVPFSFYEDLRTL